MTFHPFPVLVDVRFSLCADPSFPPPPWAAMLWLIDLLDQSAGLPLFLYVVPDIRLFLPRIEVARTCVNLDVSDPVLPLLAVFQEICLDFR